MPTTLHQTPTHTQTLATATARQLATAMDPLSHDHSWPVVSTSDLTKSKCSMKLPEEIAELGVLALHTLFSKINSLLIFKGTYKLLVNKNRGAVVNRALKKRGLSAKRSLFQALGHDSPALQQIYEKRSI